MMPDGVKSKLSLFGFFTMPCSRMKLMQDAFDAAMTCTKNNTLKQAAVLKIESSGFEV